MSLSKKISTSTSFSRWAIRKWNVKHVFALVSGGDDSLATALIASRHKQFAGVIHIDTGINIQETEDYVKRVCAAQEWPLFVYKPVTTYKMLIVQHGFPGPGSHRFMYTYLKERPLRQAVKELRDGGRIGLVTGVRIQESKRRMGNIESVSRNGNQVWIAPIKHWSKRDCVDIIRNSGVERNPVAQTLHMSGECLCGAYVKPDERQLIEIFYPKTHRYLSDLEALVQSSAKLDGNIEPKYCKWGAGNSVPTNQQGLFTTNDMKLCYQCRSTE
jgi:phosphoadenosine phosphosulfate reductase